MIRDRNWIHGTVVARRLRAIGIRDKPIAPASPWQNGFAERLIGSIRRECLDHIIVFSEAHLRRILTTPSERTGLCTRMRRFLVRFIRPESFVHNPSSAGFTITKSSAGFVELAEGSWSAN
jgi:transposase InsO family protein